jgi:hypothetical protein
MKTIAQQLQIKDFPFMIKDKDGNLIYYEDSTGYWFKSERNDNGKEIYYENSDGIIKDNRPKTVEVTLQQIAYILNIKVEQLRIKV